MPINHNTTGRLQTKNSKRHDATCRMLDNALTLHDEAGWQAFSIVAAIRLDDTEKAALSFSALSAQDPQQARLTVHAALNGTRVDSLAPFIDTPAGRAALIEWREQRDRRRAR